MKADYITLTHAGRKAVWIYNFMISLDQLNMPLPIYIHGNNMSSISLLENAKTHQHIKHIDVRYHWIQEQVAVGQFKIIHEPGNQLLADSFMKPLKRIKFTNFVKELSLKSKSS